jgi:diguanylate cyclase (GGDEF)-like protein
MWPRFVQYFKQVKMFLIKLTLILSLCFSVIYAAIYFRSNELLLDMVKRQASSYLDLIVATRSWNANYTGVFVERKKGVESNPYLKMLGINPDITCQDGRVFTLRNPALMTKEISALINNQSDVRFHLTSLRPVNPENAPDSFEQSALLRFEQGDREMSSIDRRNGSLYFRYMKPLYVERSCLTCHKNQGYKVGDIRGGISVSVPFGRLEQEMKENMMITIILLFLMLGLLLGTMYFLVYRLVQKMNMVQEQLKEMSITDELTGIRNRRFIMERLNEEFQRAKRSGKPLGAMMLDLDYFKRINDTYGHSFGDAVIKRVAVAMKEHLREYDLLGRLGGEEFLIVSPDVEIDDVVGFAERIREIIKTEKIVDGMHEISVTASIGVTALNDQDTSPDGLLGRADNALYKAKEGGRDRVVVL